MNTNMTEQKQRKKSKYTDEFKKQLVDLYHSVNADVMYIKNMTLLLLSLIKSIIERKFHFFYIEYNHIPR